MAEAKTAPAREIRSLRIAYTDDSKVLPDFQFNGQWTGFEISTVVSNLRRAYLKNVRSQRRAVPSETSTTLTKEAA